jgi:NitT/TauT family transport system permease protein
MKTATATRAALGTPADTPDIGPKPSPPVSRLVELALPVAFIWALLLVWHLVVTVRHIESYMVPTPLQVFEQIASNWRTLASDAGVTFREAFAGFACAAVLAAISAIPVTQSKLLDRAAYPVIVGVQAVPIVAVAPLIVVWFGNGLVGKMILAALIAYFPITVNIIAGLRATRAEHLELFRVFAATRAQTFFRLRLPASLPFVFTGLRIGASLSVVGAIVAELAGSQCGLGYRVLIASYQLNTPLMFAAITVAGLMGVLFFYGVALIGDRMTAWESRE